MNNKKILLRSLNAALLSAISFNACADLITFDDIDTSISSALVPDNYRGFEWSNTFVAINGTKPLWVGTGYEHGMVSGPNVGVNGGGDSVYFSSKTPFDLHSMYVTKAWHDGITHFDGYIGTTLTYSVDVFSTTLAPTFVTFDWSGINKVVMSDGDYTMQSAIDNIDYVLLDPIPDPAPNPVPEPQTYAMLIAGIGILGIARTYRIKAS